MKTDLKDGGHGVPADHQLIIAVGDRGGWGRCSNKEVSWGEFAARMTSEERTVRIAKTVAEFHAMTKQDRNRAKEQAWIALGRAEVTAAPSENDFDDRKRPMARTTESFPTRSVVGLDIDEATPSFVDNLIAGTGALAGFEFAFHATVSSTSEKPRVRIFFPLEHEIGAEDHDLLISVLLARIHDRHDGVVIDEQASRDMARLYYLPTLCADAPHVTGWNRGDYLPVTAWGEEARRRDAAEACHLEQIGEVRSKVQQRHARPNMARDAVRDRWQEVLTADGANLLPKRNGKGVLTRCVWHSPDNHPSLDITNDGLMVCRACGEGGDCFSYLERSRGCDFKEALRWSCEVLGVPFTESAATLQQMQRLQQGTDAEPQPLLRPLTEPEPYPTSAFGALEVVVSAIARLSQAPAEIAGQSVLGAASLAVQALADVRVPTGRTEPASLSLLTLAGSGDRKSTCDDYALRGVRAFERDDNERYRREFAEYQTAKDAWTAMKSLITGTRGRKEATSVATQQERIRRELDDLGPEPQAPMRAGLLSTAPTAEGLQRRLAEGSPTAGIFSTEGGSFLGGHAMSDEARSRTTAVLNELWDGTAHTRDRASSGSIRLAGKRLSLHLAVTPGVGERFLALGDVADIGFFSRTLVASPPSLAGNRYFREPDPSDLKAVAGFETRVRYLLGQPLPFRQNTTERELEPPALGLDDEAVRLWTEFHDEVESQLGRDGILGPVKDRVNKAAANAARVALVLTLASDPGARVVGVDAMKGAVDLVSWHVGEMLRLFEAGTLDPKVAAAENLRRWLIDRWATHDLAVIPRELDAPPDAVAVVSMRDVYTRGPNGLRTPGMTEPPVKMLIEHGWLVPIPNTKARYFVRSGASDGMA